MQNKSTKKENDLIYPKPQRKNFSALVITNKNTEEELWNLHVYFNEYVVKVLREVFDAQHDKRGPELKRIFAVIENRFAHSIFARLNALTSLKSNPGGRAENTEKWYPIAQKLLKKGNLLFDREKFFPKDIAVDFRQKIYEMVGQMIGSHKGLIKEWQTKKEEWDRTRKSWEKKNKGYFIIKKYFDEFEAENGKLKPSRHRWYKYLKFLIEKGKNLVKWNDQDAIFIPLEKSDFEEYKYTNKYNKTRYKIDKLIDILFKKNPQMEELDELDREWREDYQIFNNRRPSFTYPSPYKHPAYYSFKKSNTYRELDIRKRNIEVAIGKNMWLKLNFRGDERLKRLTPLENPIRIGKKKENEKRDTKKQYTYSYVDPITREIFLAEIRGIKLVFQRDRLNSERKTHGKPYLYFAIDLFWEKDRPLPKLLRVGPRKRVATLPEKLRILCVDFGQRDLAAITLSEIRNGKPVSIKLIPSYSHKSKHISPTKVWLTDIKGLTIDTIATHERELASGLRNMYASKSPKDQGSHIPKGKQGFEKLRKHIKNSKEYRYKTGSHIVLSTALKNNAQVIVVEWLENYRPTLEKTKRYNRRRLQWSIRAVQKFLEAQVRIYNIRPYYAPPAYTSQICYRCDSLGVRCTLPTKPNWEKFYAQRYPGEKRRYIYDSGGNFFYCPRCKKIINADANSSFNLAKVYVGNWETPRLDKNRKYWIYQGKRIDKEEFINLCDQGLKTFSVPVER